MTEGTTSGPARRTHDDAASFDAFQLCPSARAIEKAGVPLALGARAIDDTVRIVAADLIAERFACVLAEALAAADRADEASVVVDGAITELPVGRDPFELSELLRIKASILAASRRADDAEAESCLMQSLAGAGRQSATSWELRSAMALARFRMRRGASTHARQTLAAVYDRFTEGYETADLKAAKQLLISIR